MTAPTVETEHPWIVSADDHVVEPPSLWWDRLSKATRARAAGGAGHV